jgi:iron complex transport system substrate-binding protein
MMNRATGLGRRAAALVGLDALSLLHPDPVSLLAGWAEGGANAIQPAILRSRFPAIDRVPVVGRGSFEAIGIETIVARQPDLVLLSRFDAYRYGSDAARASQSWRRRASRSPSWISSSTP